MSFEFDSFIANISSPDIFGEPSLRDTSTVKLDNRELTKEEVLKILKEQAEKNIPKRPPTVIRTEKIPPKSNTGPKRPDGSGRNSKDR